MNLGYRCVLVEWRGERHPVRTSSLHEFNLSKRFFSFPFNHIRSALLFYIFIFVFFFLLFRCLSPCRSRSETVPHSHISAPGSLSLLCSLIGKISATESQYAPYILCLFLEHFKYSNNINFVSYVSFYSRYLRFTSAGHATSIGSSVDRSPPPTIVWLMPAFGIPYIVGGLSVHRMHDICISHPRQIVLYTWFNEWRRFALPSIAARSF